MFEILLCLLLKILVYIHFCCAKEDVFNLGEYKVTELLPEIYDTYLQAVLKDEIAVTRRLFKNNNKYMLHIQKLKEVNGVKTHNIVVTKFLRSDEPLVYINNPIESHIPNAFLTQEQFQKHLMNNIRQQQEEFENQKIQKVLSRFKMQSKKNVKLGKKHVQKYPNVVDVSPKKDVTKEPLLTRIPTKRTTTDNSRDRFIALLNGEAISDIISTTLRSKKEATVRVIKKDPVVLIDVTTKRNVIINTTINTSINDTITSDESLSEIFVNVSKDTEATTTRDVTSSERTANISSDLVEASSETTASTTTDVTSSERTAYVHSDLTENSSETTTSTTTDVTSSERTTNIRNVLVEPPSETTNSMTPDVTSSERTAYIRSDLVEPSSETTVSMITDLASSETNADEVSSSETTTNTDEETFSETNNNPDEESSSATETSEATPPMISIELTSAEPTSTQSTRSTRGRPFVFMGMD